MMRRNRAALSNAILFFLAFFSILYLNLPAGASPKLFAWNKIRYRSVSRILPSSRGICPGLSENPSKPVLLVARTCSESSYYLEELSSKYHVCPYTVDAVLDLNSIHLQTPANRGHEGMAYLTFIIDNYDDLPAAGMVFVHGSRFAWQNDDIQYDNLSLLKQLNVSRALWGPPGLPTGYWNMKCDWSAGMCDASSDDAKPQGSVETSVRAMLEPGNKKAASDAGLSVALRAIFGGVGEEYTVEDRVKSVEEKQILQTTLGRSDAVRSQCCAQFVVARENVRRHSKEEYVALRQWLLDGRESVEASGGDESDTGRAALVQNVLHHGGKSDAYHPPAPSDDLVAGRILSYIWHILFLPSSSQQDMDSDVVQEPHSDSAFRGVGVDLTLLNKLACPRADECYCRLYGRCNLPGCSTPGRCRGQYRLPPGYRLPGNWAEQHS